MAGERSFLYHCFRMQFKKEFSPLETMLFHIYLLIKHNFAGELIQNNGLYGFHNFADYQGRKGSSFYGKKEYEAEALRLSVQAQVQDNSLVSLEARIMPFEDFRDGIRRLDRIIQGADGKSKEVKHYYVIHFPKKKFTRRDISENSFIQIPRNRWTRKNAKKAVDRLERYIEHNELRISYPESQQRIYGIDACSKEIGCGPENFATEFRYMRDCIRRREEAHWWQRPRADYKQLGITYHAGEDFLDIVDGLRAIDEAIEYLGYERGDRIGHAIALGIRPEDFYAVKRYDIFLTKQAYLDNLIWMLYRSLEWNILINPDLRIKLEQKAKELLRYIFCLDDADNKYNCENMDYYYYSRQLRGDHPDIYSDRDILPDWMWTKGCYEQYMRNYGRQLEAYRKIHQVKDLVRRYHFDSGVKKRSLEAERLKIDDWKTYIELVSQFQERLQRKIADAGIVVECNLTSNVLISVFRRYDAHPVLRFNRHILDAEYHGANIMVSVNTDDLGVFATSLGNEYALLLCALRKMRHMDGKYDDTVIYEYLEYLRECGIRMTFR